MPAELPSPPGHDFHDPNGFEVACCLVISSELPLVACSLTGLHRKKFTSWRLRLQGKQSSLGKNFHQTKDNCMTKVKEGLDHLPVRSSRIHLPLQCFLENVSLKNV